MLPTFLGAVPAHILRIMWFQHNDVPAQSTTVMSDYLNRTFEARWIGRGGLITWPHKSADLSPTDFFLSVKWRGRERLCVQDRRRQ